MTKLIYQFITLVPGLLVAFCYGRITGDMQNAMAVGGLMLGMWLGARFAGLTVKAGA